MPARLVTTLGFAIVGSFALAFLAAPVAAAQRVDARLKLGMETAVFEYSSTRLQNAGTTSPNDSTDEVTLGFAPARAGVDLAYGIADTLVLGTRLLLVHSSTESAGGAGAGAGGLDIDTTILGVVPHLDYVFPGDGTARVFLGPMVGFGVGSAALGSVSDGSAHLFLFGANFGVHIFAARGVSIDPRLALSYALGETSYDMAIGGTTTGTSADLRVLAVSALLGISAWM
jgi:hypothetical protein